MSLEDKERGIRKLKRLIERCEEAQRGEKREFKDIELRMLEEWYEIGLRDALECFKTPKYPCTHQNTEFIGLSSPNHYEMFKCIDCDRTIGGSLND